MLVDNLRVISLPSSSITPREMVEMEDVAALNINVNVLNSCRSLESTYLLPKSSTSLVEISFPDIALPRLIGTYFESLAVRVKQFGGQLTL